MLKIVQPRRIFETAGYFVDTIRNAIFNYLVTNNLMVFEGEADVRCIKQINSHSLLLFLAKKNMNAYFQV